MIPLPTREVAKIARVRIGRIKLKSGGEVRLLPNVVDSRKVDYFNEVAAAFNALSHPMAGFAFVAWDLGNCSIVKCRNATQSPVETVLIPDYARALIAENIAEYRASLG